MIKKDGIKKKKKTKNKKELLSHYLHEAYCCYRRFLVFEIRNRNDIAYSSKIKSAKFEMDKYINLAQDIADQLDIDWIDWSEPKKFVTYLF